MRVVVFFILICIIFPTSAQNHIRAYGVFGGLSIPFTFDEGLQEDPRFRNKIVFRGIPIGLSYSYDYNKFGFVITPSYVQVGQQYIINNVADGDVGIRDIKMDYLSLPIAFKIHIANFSFFRFSLITSVGVNYLLNGQETLTFSASTLKYPESVRVPDKPGYVVKKDGGVATPDVNNELYVSHDKFNPIQVFLGVGARFDIDISEKWGLDLDVRAHYGVFDPRTSAYKAELRRPTGAPDLNGMRRDMYVSIAVGVVRTIQIKKRRRVKSTTNKPIEKVKYKRPKW